MLKQKESSAGFTMIVLLVSLVIIILLSLYAYSRTMKQVQESTEKEVPELDVPAPTIQNYQQTLDSVKQNLNESVGKEQKQIDEAQKEINR